MRVKLISSDCGEATGIIKNLTWTLRIGKFSRGRSGERIPGLRKCGKAQKLEYLSNSKKECDRKM